MGKYGSVVQRQILWVIYARKTMISEEYFLEKKQMK